ncbi:LytR/AlgR family response regulator transcription factor [Chitinophaga sancti]|uniref:LytTR family DNA-binding domain-containing protein n=3 Tax=Chitinophaga sancti TaxID=1004 RepID=A0A1K1RTK5_9BACT|nr:LytTR family DNA-binding domain-containing protein [Chitinophaga sancti]WQD62444.1 LytTR family DNA-binding domain-containing protein [Chitinophaga sancti]WQG91987.1 LytTR family DNA-binding domain-containing protein [Chitinophaga sancti]SFW75087.1 two component transcriptional regulator, LytTR family [Chitinophaga sancti]
MISAVIIEDEPLTANRLKRLIENEQGDITVIALLQTVSETLDWLGKNPEPDLYFMDIQLSDGLSFDVFRSFPVSKPVIFTTAFDEYAIKAFKANGIDYLLKPIVSADLESSLRRFHKLRRQVILPDNIQNILKGISQNQVVYKANILVEWRDQLLSIPVSNIAYFWTANRNIHFITNDRKIYFVSVTLDQLEEELNPHLFFRISRQFLISRDCIELINIYFGKRLKLQVSPKSEEEVIVSRERITDFKAWLNK